MSDPATTLDRLVARAGLLHSLPAVAMKVLELTSNPQVDTRALKECIENDPALTAKLLRVVNSSLFGLSREVSDLNQALALLGTKPLKMLVLGFSLPAGLFANVAGETLARYWRHTLTKAVAGREISERLFHVPGDDAFIAGLLQDLGELLLIQELGEPYVKFLEKVAAHGKDLYLMEEETIGFDHATLSARLLAHWGLPEVLVEAVGAGAAGQQSRQGADPHPTQGSLPQILYLAELLARLLADGDCEALARLLDTRHEDLDLSREKLEALAENLEEKVRSLADVLSLQLPGGRDYRDVLVDAHEQLAGVAGEVAEEMLVTRVSGSRAAEPWEEDSLLSELRCLVDEMAEASRRPLESPHPKAPDPASAGPTPGAPCRTDAAQPGARAQAPAVADSGLLERLSVAVAACRQSRCSLSLLLVQLDRADELVLTGGVEGFQKLKRSLETMCREVDHPCAMCVAYGEAGFALVLPDCERSAAVRLGNQLIEQVRALGSPGGSSGGRPASISVGVATVAMLPRNFLPNELLKSADRCLYGSSASGGGVVKSIEIY